MSDEDQSRPRVCDYSRLSTAAHAPRLTMAQEFQQYALIKEEMQDSIEPRLLAANQAAFSSALNGLMRDCGYDKRHPAIVGEPDPELRTPGLNFSFDIFGWLRRLFGRDG